MLVLIELVLVSAVMILAVNLSRQSQTLRQSANVSDTEDLRELEAQQPAA